MLDGTRLPGTGGKADSWKMLANAHTLHGSLFTSRQQGLREFPRPLDLKLAGPALRLSTRLGRLLTAGCSQPTANSS